VKAVKRMCEIQQKRNQGRRKEGMYYGGRDNSVSAGKRESRTTRDALLGGKKRIMQETGLCGLNI
jgi:hypothetical protein